MLRLMESGSRGCGSDECFLSISKPRTFTAAYFLLLQGVRFVSRRLPWRPYRIDELYISMLSLYIIIIIMMSCTGSQLNHTYDLFTGDLYFFSILQYQLGWPCEILPHQDWGGGSRPAGGHIYIHSMMQKKNVNLVVQVAAFVGHIFFFSQVDATMWWMSMGSTISIQKIRGRSMGWCTPKTIVYPQNGAVVEDLIFYLLTLDLGNWFYRSTLQVTEPGSLYV